MMNTFSRIYWSFVIFCEVRAQIMLIYLLSCLFIIDLVVLNIFWI